MKLTKTTEHEIKFTIEAFWNEEGGMGHDCFGGEVNTLEEAVHLLELAEAANRAKQPQYNCDWVIVGNVTTKIKK